MNISNKKISILNMININLHVKEALK